MKNATENVIWQISRHFAYLLVCRLFACLFACLLACLLVCLFVWGCKFEPYAAVYWKIIITNFPCQAYFEVLYIESSFYSSPTSQCNNFRWYLYHKHKPYVPVDMHTSKLLAPEVSMESYKSNGQSVASIFHSFRDPWTCLIHVL